MAPSPSDYEGAKNGIVIFGGLMIGSVILLAIAGVDSKEMANMMILTLGPLFAILGLAIVLCGIAAVIVYALTGFFPQKYQLR